MCISKFVFCSIFLAKEICPILDIKIRNMFSLQVVENLIEMNPLPTRTLINTYMRLLLFRTSSTHPKVFNLLQQCYFLRTFLLTNALFSEVAFIYTTVMLINASHCFLFGFI